MSYDEYRQRVRRYRRTDVLLAVARLQARLELAAYDETLQLRLPDVVRPFGLAGIARTALIAGNDHRNAVLTEDGLYELCSYYIDVDMPAVTKSPEGLRWRALMNQVAYEQFPHQFSAMENIGRTLSLLVDHFSPHPNAPTPDQWATQLGVPLDGFMRVGFALYTAAVHNSGNVGRDVLKMDHVAPIFSPLGPDEALEVVDRWFAAAPEELRAVGAAAEIMTLEKWSLNPLLAMPIVSLSSGRYVMPWPRLILDRISPSGLYFIGLELFGPTFPESLGLMFQDYIGTHLRLLSHATVHPEITYGKHGERTVDYLVVTREAVALVEVKAARPIAATRLGEPPGDEDTTKKIGHAFAQIERTADLIRHSHPALAAIPSDRPLVGLVVTLEPFHLLNSPLFDDVVQRPSIPMAVTSSHELEGTVALLQDVTDVGQRVLNALTSASSDVSLVKAAAGLPVRPNPLLAGAWERFSAPWSQIAAKTEALASGTEG